MNLMAIASFILCRGFSFWGDDMKKTICPGCHLECEKVVESGEFDADGPAGTIRGNHGDIDVSECCGDEVEEIDADLHDWWLDLKKLAIEKELDWLIAGPEDHIDGFNDGDSVEEELDNVTDAAASSL